jgi:hypothetical protein
MKIIFFLVIVPCLSGCVKFNCYSSINYAKEQGDKYCRKANNDRDLCKSLEIAGKKVCRVSNDNPIDCLVSGYGKEMFIRIYYNECVNLDEQTCNLNKACDFTFKNPLDMRFN